MPVCNVIGAKYAQLQIDRLKADMVSKSILGIENKIDGEKISAWRASHLLDDAEFGEGWRVLFGKTVLDILRHQDSVWELIYPQNPMKFRPHEPAEGGLLTVAHIPHDGISWEPGDLTVLTYTDPKGTEYRLHPSRYFRFKDLVAKYDPLRVAPKRWARLFEEALFQVLGVKCQLVVVEPEMPEAEVAA